MGSIYQVTNEDVTKVHSCFKHTFTIYLDLQILCFKEGNRVLSAVHFMIVILAQKTAGCYGRKQMVTKDVFEKIRQEDVLGCYYSCSS